MLLRKQKIKILLKRSGKRIFKSCQRGRAILAILFCGRVKIDIFCSKGTGHFINLYIIKLVNRQQVMFWLAVT